VAPRERGRDRVPRPHLDPVGAIILPGAESEPATGRERFDAALAAGATDGARERDLEVASALAEASISRIAELMYGSNAVFLLEFEAKDPDGDAPLRAVYKPVRGERPLWDFPRHTLFLREVAAYLVDAALDLGHVPPTVLRDGPLGPGSVQHYVRASRRLPDETVTSVLEAQLRDIAMLDVLINNADRKRAHLMLGADMRMRAIDNALSFLPYPRQRTALIELGGTALRRASRRRLHALASDHSAMAALRGRLLRLLSAAEVDAFVQRVEELDRDPVYPVLDDWDGRPFEWW
jgi:hypothetical protein